MLQKTISKSRVLALLVMTAPLFTFTPFEVAADGCDVPLGPNVVLTNCYLNRRDLSGLDLRGANLSGALLINADLRNTNLSGADLSGANLSGADLRRTNFSNANLTGAFMVKAMIGRMDVTGAQMGGLTWNNMKKCASGSLGVCE